MSESEHIVAHEQAVVGEPASEPHQAVVVGEPQQEMTPVLGEPVPLANGVKDQEPTLSLTSIDAEPASNGVQPTTSNSDSQETTAEGLVPPGTPDVPEDPNSSEVSTEVVESPTPDIPRSEPQARAVPTGAAMTEENSTQAEMLVAQPPPTEAGGLVGAEDASIERADAADESVDNKENPIPEDTVVSHIDEVPAEAVHPVAEVPTENPYQALEELSTTDDRASQDDPSKEQEYTFLDETPTAGEADSSLVKSQDSQGQYGAIETEGKPKTVSEREHKTGGSETSAEATHVIQRDVPLQESHVSETTQAREAIAATDDTSVSEQKDALMEGYELQCSEKVGGTPEEAPVFQALSEDNGGNTHHCDVVGQAVDRDLVLPKDKEKDPKGSEKPSFGFKLPLIISGLAVAALGVAFISFRRPH